MSFTHAKKRLTHALRTKAAFLFTPKPHQSKAIEFGVSRPAAGFFLAPGLGKTMIILCIFKILKKLGVVDELLVLAKRRIIYNVWRQEAKKWGLPFKMAVVHGSKKHDALWEPADVRLLNYDGLPWLAKQKDWLRRKKRVMLACDESSKLKNSSTKRFRTLRKLLPHFKRRYIATGSPAPMGLMGLFSQTMVLDAGETFGVHITKFRNEYFRPYGFMGRQWKLQKGADKRIFKLLKPLVIRFGSDQLKMPPLTFLDKVVQLPERARSIYTRVEEDFIVKLHKGKIVAANAAVATQKLRQIANGGVFYTDREDEKRFTTVHDEKCEELLELLEELNGEPALVAVEFTHDKARLKKYLAKYAPQFKDAPFVDGKTKEKEVMGIISQWDEGELPVVFGNPSSIAHGLNLQGKGGIVIYFSLVWSLEDYEQFYQRVWRQGQTRRVLVYRIIAEDTVDERVCEVLKMRNRTEQSLLRAMERHYEGR